MQRIRKYLRPRRLIPTCVIVALLVGAIVFLSTLQGPVQGEITQSGVVRTSQTTISHFNGKSISFDYSTDLIQTSENQPQPHVEESYIFNKKSDSSSPAAYLAVTVYGLPSGKLQDNSGYALRESHRDLYSKRVVAINGNSFTIFTKTDTREVVAYTAANKQLTSIALTSPLATTNQLQERFDTVLNSFRWK